MTHPLPPPVEQSDSRRVAAEVQRETDDSERRDKRVWLRDGTCAHARKDEEERRKGIDVCVHVRRNALMRTEEKRLHGRSS